MLITESAIYFARHCLWHVFNILLISTISRYMLYFSCAGLWVWLRVVTALFWHHKDAEVLTAGFLRPTFWIQAVCSCLWTEVWYFDCLRGSRDLIYNERRYSHLSVCMFILCPLVFLSWILTWTWGDLCVLSQLLVVVSGEGFHRWRGVECLWH